MIAAAIVLALLGAWEAYCRLDDIDPLVLPAPSDVLDALWEDRGLLADDAGHTGAVIALGLLAAVACGVLLACSMHLWPPLRRALEPLVVGSQAVPVPVIAPLLVIALGFGLAPKVLIVALVCFFPIAIGLLDGLRSADPDARKLLRTLGAGRLRTLRVLELPAALPSGFTGLRVAAVLSVVGAVFAELSGSERGLGHTLTIANGQLETARAFAACLLLLAIAMLLYALFAVAERLLVGWAPRHRHGAS